MSHESTSKCCDDNHVCNTCRYEVREAFNNQKCNECIDFKGVCNWESVDIV